MAALRRVCEDTPRPIQRVNPEIPDWLVAIIETLLAKDASERFQSASEVAELLGITYDSAAGKAEPTQPRMGTD